MYEMAPGSILVIQPHHAYRIRPQGEGPMRLIILNFDYTRNRAELRTLLPVVVPEDYHGGEKAENVFFADDPRKNEPIYLPDGTEHLPLLEEMLNLVLPGEDMAERAYGDTLLKLVLLRIFRRTSAEETEGKGLMRYVREHAAEPLTPEELGEKFGYHPGSISRILRRQTGMPLHRYLVHLRLQRAAVLLTDTEMTVEEIAETCGFCGSPHLCRVFQKRMGLTPQAFRRRGRLG